MVGDILLIIFSFALIISGAFGIILPFLPGVPVAWLGMLAFAYATEFAIITWKVLLIFLALTIFTVILDVIAPLLGAKKYRATRYGVMGAFFGLLFGLMLFGPLGIILGPFLGAFVGELFSGKIEEEAFRSAKGTVIGFLAGSAVKLAVIMVMLGYIIFALL